MSVPLWVAQLAENFWAEAGVQDRFPRDLAPAIERSQPLTVVELAGLDASGSVVSRGRTSVTPRDFTGTTPWPFTIRLRPAGAESRFAVRVVDVLPKVTPGR